MCCYFSRLFAFLISWCFALFLVFRITRLGNLCFLLGSDGPSLRMTLFLSSSFWKIIDMTWNCLWTLSPNISWYLMELSVVDIMVLVLVQQFDLKRWSCVSFIEQPGKGQVVLWYALGQFPFTETSRILTWRILLMSVIFMLFPGVRYCWFLWNSYKISFPLLSVLFFFH